MKNFKSLTLGLMLLLGLATYSNAASMDKKMDKMNNNMSKKEMMKDSSMSSVTYNHQQLFVTDFTTY